jgi:hypothetical protein
MPALPWVQREAVDPGTTYLVMASRLPLERRRSVPGFLRDTLAIRSQLARSTGLVGYGLDAQVLKGVFWTYSVWRSREHLEMFARTDPHRSIVERLRPSLGHARFEFASLAGDELPATWEERKAPLR